MLILHEQVIEEFANRLSRDFACPTYRIDVQRFSNNEFNVEQIHLDDDHVLVLFPNALDINAQFLKYCFIIQNICHTKIIDLFMPYIPYSRQDQSKSFMYVMLSLKNLNIRQIFTIDIHKFTDDPFIKNILPHELFGERYINSDVIVVAPDLGAKHRAQAFAKFINSDFIWFDKVSGNLFCKSVVTGRKCLIVDDIVDTGRTVHLATKALYSAGASRVECCISSTARKAPVNYHLQISRAIARYL